MTRESRVSMKGASQVRRATGIPGLDDILNGGFPAGHRYLVEGDPGAGKTTLAPQFLLHRTKQGEPGRYVALSGAAPGARTIAQAYGRTLDGLTLWRPQ